MSRRDARRQRVSHPAPHGLRLPAWRIGLAAVAAVALGVAIYGLFSWVESFNLALRSTTAQAANLALGLLGWAASLEGTTLVVPGSRFFVSTECTSLGATAFLWGAILAFPSSWRDKSLGVLVGAVVLFAVNALRVVTLVYVAAYSPIWLDVVHLLVWQSIMVLLALALFLVWAGRFALVRRG